MDVAEPVGAPAGTAEAELEHPFLADLEPKRDRIPAADQLEPARDLDQELEPRDRVASIELQLQRDLVVLQDALPVELDVNADVGLPRIREANREQDGERHCDQRQLRAREDQRRKQAERGQDHVGAELRRRVPRHVTQAAAAASLAMPLKSPRDSLARALNPAPVVAVMPDLTWAHGAASLAMPLKSPRDSLARALNPAPVVAVMPDLTWAHGAASLALPLKSPRDSLARALNPAPVVAVMPDLTWAHGAASLALPL